MLVAVKLVALNQLFCLTYEMKAKEHQLALLSELVVQLDLHVEFFIRQRTILRMCKQDTTHIDELLLSVCNTSVETEVVKNRLQTDLASRKV